MRFLVLLLGGVLAGSVSGAELSFHFSEYAAGTVPTNFQSVLAGGGVAPVWKIVADDVPSGFTAFKSNAPLLNHSTVLAQTSEDTTDERYPMFIYRGDLFRNFKFRTQFKIVSGVIEQMAGLVFRFQNSSNFYVVRISALGKNISFYKMVNGEITSPVKLPLAITPGTWHTLEVDCSGIYIECLVDNQKALPTITDHSPPDGQLGFWTKSDAVTHFMDAQVDYTPRISPAQQMVDSILENETKLLGLRIYILDPGSTNSTHIIASKDKTEIGRPGADAELQAIQKNTVSYGRDHGAVILSLPLQDRNGDNVAAMWVKMKSFFGETQDSALTRATMIRHQLEALCPDDDSLQN
jgi:hypothetical protein